MEKRHGSPIFYQLLEEMAETHDKKSHDYASDENPTGNYEFAGQVSSMFAHSPSDAGFVGRLAEKIYRLANLERAGKSPKNESIEDTERDIAVITTLWMANRRLIRSRLNTVQAIERKVKLTEDKQAMVCTICMKNIYEDEISVAMVNSPNLHKPNHRHLSCAPPYTGAEAFSPFICNWCDRQFIDRPPMKLEVLLKDRSKSGTYRFCTTEHQMLWEVKQVEERANAKDKA